MSRHDRVDGIGDAGTSGGLGTRRIAPRRERRLRWRRHEDLVGLLALLPLLVLGWGSVCVGTDGHLALEPTAPGGCLDRLLQPGEDLRLGTWDPAGGCGPCLDLSPGTELRSHTPPPDGDAVAAVPSPAGRLAVGPGHRPDPARQPLFVRLPSLRTTILRC